MERGVYFDGWFPRQHCYHPSLPPRRLKMVEDLEAYHATSLVWASLGGGSISLPYLEQEAWGEVDERSRFYGFMNDAEFIEACQERGIKVFGCVFEVQGWEFPVELNEDESKVLSMNELRGVGKRGMARPAGVHAEHVSEDLEAPRGLLPRRARQQRRREGHRHPRGVHVAGHLRRGVPLHVGRGPGERALRLPDGPQQPGLARVPQGDHPDPDRRGRRRGPPRRGRPADLRDRLRRLLLQGLHEAVPRLAAGAAARAAAGAPEGHGPRDLPLRLVAARARVRLQVGPGDDAAVLGLHPVPARDDRRLLRRAGRLHQGVRAVEGPRRPRVRQLLLPLAALLPVRAEGGHPRHRDERHELPAAGLVPLRGRVRAEASP